jgi:hypothetical protein
LSKRAFIAVHDYGQGAVICRIYARSIEEVEQLLPRPTWVVYSEDHPDCPQWKHDNPILESDVDDQAPWLKKQIEIVVKTRAGKRVFPMCGVRDGKLELRDVWARSLWEINERYPKLSVLYGVGLSAEDLQRMGTSDVDVPDDFLKDFAK